MPEPTFHRPRRRGLSDKQIAALPRRAKRYVFADPELRGLYVRVSPHGDKSFVAVTRDSFGKQRWITLGSTDVLSIEEARTRAREVIKRLKSGLSATEPEPVKPDTVVDVCTTWLKRHVEARGLRTGDEMRRILERHVLPHWRDRPFADIRRSDIARLLDAVEDAHGPWVADTVLTTLRAVASWFAGRHDSYQPPFVRNMRRVPAQSRQRARILSDAELRAVWRAAEADDDVYGSFVRVLLLCGQRRAKLADLRWPDLDGDMWNIRTAPREKGTAGALRLPPLAMAIINAQPHFVASPFVFTGRRNGPINGFSHRHVAFVARCGVDGWTLHDLRRTARSLLSRAGVAPHTAERVLGHAIPGVAGIYDRYSYAAEIGDALAKLAGLISRILAGPADNVVELRTATV